jgi:hypothetical protein
MSFAFTPFANLLVLDFFLTTGTATRPTAWYLALHTGDPGDDGTSNEVTTGIDADYVRKSITFGAAAYDSGNDRAYTTNTNQITWTPGTGADYTAAAISIWDASTGGNCLAQAIFFVPKNATPSTPVVLQAGKVPVTLKGPFSEYSSKLVIDFLLNTETVTRPTAWYAAMHVGDPGSTGALNEVTTGIDADYVRKSITFGAAATVNGVQRCSNNSSVTWIPASGASYTVTHRSYWDALTTGNCLIQGSLFSSWDASTMTLQVASGDDVIIMKL